MAHRAFVPGAFFNVRAGKFGGKRRVEAWVGFGYNNAGAAGLADDPGQYTFTLFTEGFADTAANKGTAQALMNNLASDAATLLSTCRTGC